jgi:hypothetical protein
LRCTVSSSNEKGEILELSAFAQNHGFDDVNGCIQGVVHDALPEVSISDDPSFDGCLVFDPEQFVD